MKRSAPLKRGKPLKRTQMRATPKARARSDERREVWEASKEIRRAKVGRRCEGIGGEGRPERHADGCNRRDEHGHHVLPRRFGDDSPENCRLLSDRCHRHIHANPAESYALGLLRKGNSNG